MFESFKKNIMRIRQVILFFFILLARQTYSQNGIVYEKTTDSINKHTIDLIISELSYPTGKIFNKTLYCGPNLWERYSKIDTLLKIKNGNVFFQIPVRNKDKLIIKKGKLIQSQNDFNIFWNQIINDFDSKIRIRKLNENELKYYWSIIFFNINEPIFIVENDKYHLIFDFDKNGKLLFVEQIITD